MIMVLTKNNKLIFEASWTSEVLELIKGLKNGLEKQPQNISADIEAVKGSFERFIRFIAPAWEGILEICCYRVTLIIIEEASLKGGFV